MRVLAIVFILALALAGCADVSAGGGPRDTALHYFCYGW